jgi:four helix bundle protein
MARYDYEKLDAWQKAIELAECIDALTEEFPDEERFGLASQMRRAAVLVPAHIAEGCGQHHRGDCLYHLSLARGLLAEAMIHLTLAARMSFVERERAVDIGSRARHVGGLLTELTQSRASVADAQEHPDFAPESLVGEPLFSL